MPHTYPAVDESFALLHAAGWSVGDVGVLTPSGPRWLVTGTNGENALHAEGVSQADAWAHAVEQAGPWGCWAARHERSSAGEQDPGRFPFPGGGPRCGGAGGPGAAVDAAGRRKRRPPRADQT